MFSKTIIDSDLFLDMPLSTQALYFHLSMRADDEGFVNNPKKIARMIGADEDSLKLLAAKQFIIPFESGIVVIRHWKIHNYIQKDRLKTTAYTTEKSQLTTNTNGEYSLNDIKSRTDCTQNGYKTDTQDSIGKYSIDKSSIVEDSKDKILSISDNKESMSADALAPAKSKREKFIPPTVEEVQAYCKETGKPINAEAFVDYFTSNGWKVGGKTPMKDWKAAVRQWRRRDEENGKVYKGDGIDHSLDFMFPG